MIARLLISNDLNILKEQINQNLSLHLGGLSLNQPDLLYFETGEKLGIEQARIIKQHFSMKPFSAKGRVVVLEDASLLTMDAQNALLKLLEEPPENAILILGAPSEDKFLPTVLSRCQTVILASEERARPESYQKDVEKLLTSSIEERFEYIEKCKDREEFLHALADYFRSELHAPGQRLVRLGVTNFLKELLQAEEWTAQNVNIRAILEYLMLVMPEGT